MFHLHGFDVLSRVASGLGDGTFTIAACVALTPVVADVASEFAKFTDSGWTSTGLVMSVLGWVLLRHLPEQDRQRKETQERHEQLIERLVQTHTMAMEKEVTRCDAGRKESREEFRQSLETVCEPMTRAIEVLGRIIERWEHQKP